MTVRRPLTLLLCLAALAAVPGSASGAELGLNVNGAVTGGTQENFADLQNLGARWARHFVFWDDLDESGLKLYDAMAREEDRLGIKTLFTVMSARGQPPGSAQAYADFMGRLAARNRGSVEAYEVWNEADEGLFWNGGPQPAAYVDVLRRSYSAIKASDPNATVLFSPTVGNNYGFLADAYRAGAKGQFDAMAVHTDTACLDRPPSYFYREADGRLGRFTFLAYREVRATMLANEDPKPIWMTEFGWSAAQHPCEFGESAGKKPAGVSEGDQAQHLLAAMNCMEADPFLQVAFWYNNRDLSADGKMANMYGLRRFNGTQRPAYDAFRTWATGGGRSSAPCGDFEGPSVRILAPAPDAVLPPDSPLYIRAQSSGTDLSRIRFRVPGTQFAELRSLAPEPNGAGEITWEEAARLPAGDHTLEVVAFDELGNPGPPATLPFKKVSASAPFGGLQPVSFPRVRLTGRGRTRTLRGGSPPGILGGALRVEWLKKKGRRWVRYHAKTVVARRPYVVRQRLRSNGLWRVRVVFLGKPPHRRTFSCWIQFRTTGAATRQVCPRGAVRLS
jgi:Bacterial Ig domain